MSTVPSAASGATRPCEDNAFGDAELGGQPLEQLSLDAVTGDQQTDDQRRIQPGEHPKQAADILFRP